MKKLRKFISKLVDQSAIQIQTDEADYSLTDLTQLIFIYRKVILLTTSIIIFISIFYSLSLPRYYQSNILMVTNSGSSNSGSLSSLLGSALGSSGNLSLSTSKPNRETALAILRSRKFIEGYIEDNDLMPILFKDAQEEKGIEMPILREGYSLIESAMNIQVDRSLIEMTITWDDPKFATRLANGLIERVNDYIRKEAIEESRKSIQFLEKELTNKDANTKVILSKLIENQMQSMVLANVRNEYVFKVVDPAVTPINPSGPQRRLIVVLVLFWALYFHSLYLYCIFV